MRGRPKKAAFSDLDQEFKDTVANMTDDEIRRKLAEVAIAEHENKEAKKADVDLQQKKEAYNVAGAQYREATAQNKLRTAYAYSILEARGKV